MPGSVSHSDAREGRGSPSAEPWQRRISALCARHATAYRKAMRESDAGWRI